MSEPECSVVDWSTTPPTPDLLAQVDAIFWQTSVREPEPGPERDAFRERWLGRFLQGGGDVVLLAMIGTDTVAGYLVGALDNPTEQARFADIGYFREEFAHLTPLFPAHLHINLAPAFRSQVAPGVMSPALRYTRTIVGADDVRAGRTPRPSGVVARDRTLVVRFTQAVRDFAEWTTMPFFCAVPPTLQPSAEGVRFLPGAGPYYVTEYRPNQRVVLRRNRFYGGMRAHHVDGFNVDLTVGSVAELLERTESGKADWGYTVVGPHLAPGTNFFQKYGLNEKRFFHNPGLTVRMYVLNSSRPLFHDNPNLRLAVNVALDRTSLGHPAQGRWTEQYIPDFVPGHQERLIYPLGGDLARAKALARGNTRGGKAVLYVTDFTLPLATAQQIKQQLEPIGLEVEIKPIPEHVASSAYLGRLGEPDEPWDLALVLWSPDFVDPSGYINQALDAQAPGARSLAGFDEPNYLDLMRRAAGLQGTARQKAYRDLDLRLARDAAPLVPLDVLNEATLVSARVGCVVQRPSLVLTTVCLED